MMKIEGVIFDLDGTLLDSMYIWDTIGSDYLIQRGMTPEVGLNEKFKTMSIPQAAQYYKDVYGLTQSIEEIMKEVDQMIESLYANEFPLKRGVLPLLEAFHKNGIKMCIATATSRPMVEAALKHHQLAHYFSEIFTCSEIGFGKDNPMIFENALAKLGTCKSKTLVFEDSLHAIETAKQAGFSVVSVYDKSSEKDQMKIKECSDFHINSMEEWRMYV